jgi:hypothetical protein
MATFLKVLNNLADIKSAGGVALRVRTQGGDGVEGLDGNGDADRADSVWRPRLATGFTPSPPGASKSILSACAGKFAAQDKGTGGPASLALYSWKAAVKNSRTSK